MDPNQVADTLSAPLTSGQTLKSTAFTHAVNQQSSLMDSLQIEQSRVEALHGADSKKAQTIRAYVAMRQQSLARTQATAATAQTRTPIANPQEFIVYGFVYGQSGAGVAEVSVSAADANGTIYATTNSDASGSYALHIGARKTAGTGADCAPGHREGLLHELAHEAVEVVEKVEECLDGEDGTQAKAPPPVTLHLVASDQKKTFQVQSQETFSLVLGKLAYQDLTVPV